MKNIDVKSLLIGTLLTSTIFLGVAATGATDKWDGKQEWDVKIKPVAEPAPKGAQPFAVVRGQIYYRARVK